MKFFSAIVAIFCISLTARATPLPERFSATYSLKKGIIEFGETQRTLAPISGGRYVFESITKATGMFVWLLPGKITERSTWTYDKGAVLPLEYFYERIGGNKPRTATLVFDWGKNTLTNKINNEPWTMALEPGTLDKLIYQLILMRDIVPGKRDYAYKIADGGRVKVYRIVVFGEEVINTRIGKFNTVKVSRVGDKRNTVLWCAPKLNYLPVRIEQNDNDANFIATLESLEGITPK